MNIVDDLQYLKDSKEIIRQSIESKGVEVPTDVPFRQYSDKIGEISGGGEETLSYQKYFSLYRVGANTNVTEDGILTCVSTQNSDDNKVVIASRAPLSYYGFTAECKFNMSETVYGANIIIGGNTNDAFVIGVDPPNSNCIGIWYKDYYNYSYDPSNSHGITPIQVNKDYWLRFTYKMNTYLNDYTYTIEMKESKNEDYHLEWQSSRNHRFYNLTGLTQIIYGGGYYANTLWSFNGTVDLKECNLVFHPGTGVAVEVGG